MPGVVINTRSKDDPFLGWGVATLGGSSGPVTIGSVIGLSAALAGKASFEHEHTIEQIVGLQAALTAAANSGGSEGGSSFLRGIIPEGTSVNTLREPGVWVVPSVAHAQKITNWPSARAGSLLVVKDPSANAVTQEATIFVSNTGPMEKYSRGTISTAVDTWSPWSNPEWIKGTLNGTAAARVNLDTYTTTGLWAITSRTYVDGLPATSTGVGMLENIVQGSFALRLQRFTERVKNDEIRVWHRYSLVTSGWTGVAWDLLNKPQTAAPGGGSSTRAISADVTTGNHASRVEYARSRRGGGIGTNGVPVFMWRFDHWLIAFRDKCLPHLRDNNLVGTLNMNYDNMSNVQNGAGSITWDQVQEWNQYYGIEIANHGSTHTNANTRDLIYHEVVDGRRNLEKAMPRVAVETWHEHGSAYMPATDIEGDTGLDLGRGLEGFTESYAGRLVLAEHAVVEGKCGGFYPPLTGHPQIGQSHYSMDRQKSSEAIEIIKLGQEMKRGLTGYIHPGLLDTILVGTAAWAVTYHEDGKRTVTPSGTGTAQEFESDTAMREWATTNGHIVYMTEQDFREICEYVAAERDAGRLMVMSAAGGAFADISHGRRENLLLSPTFETPGRWTVPSGYTVTDPGPNVRITTNSTASTLTQGMLLYTRFGWAMGAAHELLVWAKADAETTLTMRMEQLGNPTNWSTQKLHTVPGDGVLRPYRLNVTLPRDKAITQMTVRIGGPTLTMEGPPVLAAI